MSLSNQEKFVNSFWVIILLVAVGIYFLVIPKNSIAEACYPCRKKCSAHNIGADPRRQCATGLS